MNPKQIGLGILVVAIIGIAVFQFGSKKSTTADNATGLTGGAQVISPTIMSGTSEKATYKDGEYSAKGNYTSPAQVETVDIAITLKDGVVTGATFQGEGTNPTTKKMQGLFSEGFKEQVVGKPIDEIALTVVNGSSLTPKGFMDALKKVKTEAQASSNS